MCKMFKIINIFEIISNYLKCMQEDLRLGALIANLVILPSALALIMTIFVKDLEIFANSLILITSITIPLLLNVMIIIHYSVERVVRNDLKRIINLKLKFLKHINAITSMEILLSITILIISIIIKNIEIEKILILHNISVSFQYALYALSKFIFMFLVSFFLINFLIVLLRVYRLINFEIMEYSEAQS